ncbi:MAG: dihydrodipicolinate synthase family protein [Planctomycetota bacterium]|jgi:4-hydroxy-tetrahydrodipicolinate synthase
MINRMKGVVPIVLTPLKKNGDIDIESCATLIEFLIENGVAGLYILGSASENFLLDIEQRIDVVCAMAEANRGRVPLIAGCGNMAPRNVLRFFKAVEKAELSGFHYIAYDLKIGDERLIHLLKAYADAAPFPLYLYHNVKRGRAITVNVATSLKSHPNVWGMKVGGYDLSEMQQFLTLEDDEFQVLGSGGSQFYAWLALGAEAVTASASCCFPKEFKEMYDLFSQGDMEGAKNRQMWWQTFQSHIPNTAPENGEYAAEEKYILMKKGVIRHDYCHFPYRRLTEAEKQQVVRALAKYCSV